MVFSTANVNCRVSVQADELSMPILELVNISIVNYFQMNLYIKSNRLFIFLCYQRITLHLQQQKQIYHIIYKQQKQ